MRQLLILTALLASAGGAQAAQPSLDQLAGCWRAQGHVAGKASVYDVRLTRQADADTYLFELHSPDAGDPYDAAVPLAQKGDGSFDALWMDSTGVSRTALGTGRVALGAVEMRYDYGDSELEHHFASSAAGWHWRIDRRDRLSGQTAMFAEYDMSRAQCPRTTSPLPKEPQ